MASETPKEVNIGDGVGMVKNSPILGGFHGSRREKQMMRASVKIQPNVGLT